MKPLFIHIPKNGGMTVRRGLADRIIVAEQKNLPTDYAVAVLKKMTEMGEHHGYEHARWRDVREDVRSNHKAFALVRNPWARVVSRYTFAQHAGDKAGNQSFRAFLDERFIYGSTEYFWHRAVRGWYPQVDHVTDENGVRRVDCLRLESTDLQRYFDLPQPLRRRNVSNTENVDYRTFYGAEEREIVAEWYKRDIAYFGFTFDGLATRNIWTPGSSR